MILSIVVAQPPPSLSLRILTELIQLDKVVFTENSGNFERLQYVKISVYNMHKTNHPLVYILLRLFFA